MKFLTQIFQGLTPRVLALALLAAGFLSAVSGLHAQPVVKTLTGGWWQYNTTTFYGKQITQSGDSTFSAAQFNYPSGLALDPSGTILFVADYTNNAVRKISNVGNNATSLTTTFVNTNKGISRPVAVVMDGATNLYVLNRSTNGNSGKVIKFDSYGHSLATNAVNLTNATAMALDGLTNLYVTIKSNIVIQITPAGGISIVGVITNTGTSLRGIAVLDNGNLALTDAGNNGIWVMNPRGSVSNNATKLTGFNGAGDICDLAAYAAFNRPEMIAKADRGMLVVADRGNHKVKLVDAAGTVTRLFGMSSNLWYSGPSSPGNLVFPGWWDGTVNLQWDGISDPPQNDPVEARDPVGVLVGPDGSVYDTEVFYHIIRKTTGTGLTANNALGRLPLFNGPAGIALDSTSSFLLIADTTNNAVQLLDFSDNQTTTYLEAADGISRPVDVALDTNDNVYVLNQSPGEIQIYDFYSYTLLDTLPGLTAPTAFTMDGSGNIFVAEQAGSIHVFGSGGSSYTLATVTNAGVQLQGIAILDDGYLAVSDAGNHVIWQINPITRIITKLTGTLGSPGTTLSALSNLTKLNQPHKLARAAGNTLVAADYGNSRLVVIQRSGAITNVLDSTNSSVWFGRPDDPALASNSRWVPMVLPVGVAVGAGGAVYSSEILYDDIRELLGTGLSPAANPVVPLSFYSSPAGIALNSGSTILYVADPTNNTVSALNLANNQTSVYLESSNSLYQLHQPVDVALDGSDNLYVLNQGTGGNGSILEFDLYGNLLKTNVTSLALPTAMTLDSAGDIYVTAQSSNILVVFPSGVTSIVATVTNAGASLQGIALLDDGTITVSDTVNHVIWQINPVSKAVSLFTGQVGSPGKILGPPAFARLNHPERLARAAGNLLVAADSGNNQIVIINSSGSITNSLISTNGFVWFGVAGDPYSATYVPMISPNGLAIGAAGTVFTSEDFYKDIRKITGTGLSQLGIGGGGGTGTNAVIIPPTISPNAGYFPMGQDILVTSPNPGVYYTTDGSEPTTNSAPVNIIGNNGHIHWFNTTYDLTSLRVKSFVNGTNASATVSGQSVTVNTVGTPKDFNPMIQAGIGSSIVIPVVCNLGTNQQIKSYQFRYEIYPLNNANTPAMQPLSIIPTNDFVPVTTAIQNGSMGLFNYASYTHTFTNGIIVSTAITNGNNGNTTFKNYAVVMMMEVQIPYAASEGDTYSLNVLYPSATSDGYNANVPLTPMAPATIVVTNIPYLVGDSASSAGSWYNAGTFGDQNLDNSDVNQAFYASSGLRTPYSFSDVFNAMDVYPPDGKGYAGGDGQIRFLDWQTILQRSLRLDTNNWSREWSTGGYLIDFTTNLVVPQIALSVASEAKSVPAPWYRQALVGGNSVGGAAPGGIVNVPVYVKLQNGSTMSGLQFRTVVTPQNGAPVIADTPQLYLASGVISPYLQKSFKGAEAAFGWQLGSFNYQSRSSNFLGWVSFTIPANAQSGHSYTVSFANADGAPDLNTQYDFESRSATVIVGTSSPATTICSDEWKVHFFSSITNTAAEDNADTDGDGIPNWMEFLAGTDPTDAQSNLKVSISGLPTAKAQLNWLTAPGRAYELQSSSSLAGGWTTIATVSGDGTVSSLSDPNSAGTTRYYRLHILP